jgi:hypothetical protein
VAKKAIAKYTNTDDAKTIEGTCEQFAPYWDASLAFGASRFRASWRIWTKRSSRGPRTRALPILSTTFAETLKSSGFLQTLVAIK